MRTGHTTKNMFTEAGPVAHGEIFTDETSFLETKNNKQYGPYAKVRLLIDTGSNISGIDSHIIQSLNLPSYEGYAEVNGVGGLHEVKKYRCVLFLNIFGMKGLPLDIIEGDYSHSAYDGVIGRDVLQFCNFSYHGPSNTFELNAQDF